MNAVPHPNWHYENKECWDFRRQMMEGLPFRLRVWLACEWAQCKMLPIFEKKFPKDHRPFTALVLARAWVKNPTIRNERVAFLFSDRLQSAIYSRDRPRGMAWGIAAEIADVGASVRINGRSTPGWCRVVNAISGVCQLPLDVRRTRKSGQERHKKEAWCHRTLQAALGPTKTSFDSKWRTSDAVAIAKSIEQTRDFSAMPILADALEEAGFSDYNHLHHMRHDADDWTLADWTLTNLLGIWPEADNP